MSDSSISFLFVPASRPDRYEKALSSLAHQVIIDLEDAVAETDKHEALTSLVSNLENGFSRPVYVRINASNTSWFRDEVEAIRTLTTKGQSSLAGIVVPKVETPEEIETVTGAVAGHARTELIALIETGVGLANLRQIGHTRGLNRFAIGAADLSFDLDTQIDSPTIDWAYAQLVIESRNIGLPAPIASPPFELDDLERVMQDSRRLRSLGVTAQMCIHPVQVQAIHEGFHPSQDEVAWAQRVFDASLGEGASQVGGQMIDKPIYARARRIMDWVTQVQPLDKS